MMEFLRYSNSQEENPYVHVARSVATDWQGFRLEHVRTSPLSYISEFSSINASLFVTVNGSVEIKWRTGKERKAWRWNTGTFTYMQADHILNDLFSTEPQEQLILDLCPKKMEALTGSATLAKDLSNLVPYLTTDDPYILALCQSMATEVRDQCPSGKMYGESVSIALITYLIGHYRSYEWKGDSYSRLDNYRLPNTTLRLLDEFIREHLDQDISLSKLAELAGLSPRHLCRCFKNSTGLSPHQYLLRERINKAKSLLTIANYSVTDTALEVGFSSTGHFSSVFQKITGVTPMKYKLVK